MIKYIMILSLCLFGCATPKKKTCGYDYSHMSIKDRVSRLETELLLKEREIERLKNGRMEDTQWAFDAYYDHENRIRKFEKRKPIGVEELEK